MDGWMVPAFATMTGLSAKELPPETCPSGTCFLEVPELCIGGRDVRADGTGTVAFARKDAHNEDWDSAERRLFKECNERVFHPFIQSIRQVDCNRDPTAAPAPDWLNWVAWCDGGIPQLQAMINDESQGQDKALKIDRNKLQQSRPSVANEWQDLWPWLWRLTRGGSLEECEEQWLACFHKTVQIAHRVS
jgi:hypothetical protein